MPWPTCGMTTSFAHAANTEHAAAFVAQPMGALLVGAWVYKMATRSG